MTDERLDGALVVSWKGKARQKIYGRALDGAVPNAETVVDVLDRQSTNVVVETVDEAAAIAGLMSRYTDAAGDEGRMWVNPAIASACERVETEIIDGMSERGYKPEFFAGGVAEFAERDEPDVEVGDTVVYLGETYEVTDVADGYVRTADGGAIGTEAVEVVET